MEFISAVKDVFNKYATFTGKADRPQFWWFLLFLLFGTVVSTSIDNLLVGYFFPSESNIGWVAILWGVFTCVPSLAVGSRRLHDTGRSGWWHVLLFVIIIGWIILIIWYCEETYEEDPAKRPIGIPQ
tara:strand:+ start:447 stop:827 length:381 start_codon:yes stop_codon:yes gene_type:complete